MTPRQGVPPAGVLVSDFDGTMSRRDFHTALPSRDATPEVERTPTYDPRLTPCLR